MINFFEVLGLPHQFALAVEQIEANYLARSRETHPDFHQLASASEQRFSLEQSAALNEAYTTLRDPFRRAEYMLALEGGPSAADSREMAPAFLEEMLELRMEIEELREGGDPARLHAMEGQLRQRRGKLVEQIAARFDAHQRQRSPQMFVEIRQLLNEAKYIQGQLRDLRAD